nr:LLM class flavin-dependent oxidoreductase [Mannheimia granulomatis]
MVRLAKHLDGLDFIRFWIAEHHNMPHLASSATQILIAHTLSHTQNICVGSGGVMLPNHSQLQVAEQYGMLHTLYLNRVDLDHPALS